MKRYAITEELGAERALHFVARNLARGVEMIQVREKQLPVGELTSLVRRVMDLPNVHGSKILVNTFWDVALACGTHGVHFPACFSSRQAPGVPDGFLVARSCHTLEEVQRAEGDGASFVVFGPVFATGDKAPVGLDALGKAVRIVRIPVYALGGITEENAPDCIDAGAAGIAGIRLFV